MATKNTFRVIIAGGRDFNDYQLLKQKCDSFLANKSKECQVIIVSGTARGADRLGERYANERGYQIERYPADWDRDGNSAGPIRNAKMAENADALIAFWNGKVEHSGTYNMIDTAMKREDMLIRIVNYTEIYAKRRQNQLLQQTAQYAKEHITNRGMHTGINWFLDSFEEYCSEAGKSLLPENDFFFNKEDIDRLLKSEPHISEIAQKIPSLRTSDDITKVRDFIGRNFAMEQEEIVDADVDNVLYYADPQSSRRAAANKVYKECYGHLTKDEVKKLSGLLNEAVNNATENELTMKR